jgi:LuxR family maltose regulon positive regulatory protein
VSKPCVIQSLEGYVLQDGAESGSDAVHQVQVGSTAWLEWLKDNRSFSFNADAGQFSALKERVRDKGWYWKAYRWQNGRRRSVYLGRSEDLSIERLEGAAKSLMQPAASNEARTLQHIPRTKLFIPTLRPGRVVRQRLLQRLRSGAQMPITVVVAPAGYGKTTLIADWVRTDKREVAWLSLDAGDNAPTQFWASFGTTLDTFDLGVSESIQAELRALQQRPTPSAIMAGVINECAARLKPDAHGRPNILVIDDLHDLTDPDLLQAVVYFADHLPPALHVVFTTRAEAHLPLARWRVQHRVSELRAADLAFNDFETRAFLADTMGVKLGDEAIAVLETRTEGWIAALQLAALSLQSHADPAVFIGQFRGNQQHVMGYLADQVLARLPDDVLDMITRAAVLDRMCDDLCRALLDNPAAAPALTLSDLQKANLFVIALDDERRWFRFHHLFVDLLRARLNTLSPGLASTVHARASQWFESAGDVQGAIHHAMLAADYTRAAKLVAADVERSWLFETLATPSEMWVEQLPEPFILQSATLMTVRASTLMRQMQIGAADLWLGRLESSLEGAAPGVDVEVARARLLMLRAYTLRMNQGETAQTLEMSERALALMPERDHVWRANALMAHASLLNGMYGNIQLMYQCVSEAGELALRHNNRDTHINSLFLGTLLMCYNGALRRADAALARAIRLLKAWNMSPATSRAWREYVMVRLAYERNELDAVEEVAQPLLVRAIAGTDHISLLNALSHLVRACMARGSPDEALRIIESAEPVCAASPFTRLHAAALNAFVLASQGETALLEGWVESIEPKLGSRVIMRIPGVHEDLRLYLARAYILLGHSNKAIPLLDTFVRMIEGKQLNDTLLRCMVLRALAHEQRGARAEALEDLRVALSMGRLEGYVRVFVDEGPAMQNLLLAARAKNIEPAYVMKLLGAFSPQPAAPADAATPGAPAAGKADASQWVEALSAREKQVLALLAAGHTNQNIADALNVTLTTVKSHTGAIYTKLGVKSRTQAIVRARELGLLP